MNDLNYVAPELGEEGEGNGIAPQSIALAALVWVNALIWINVAFTSNLTNLESLPDIPVAPGGLIFTDLALADLTNISYMLNKVTRCLCEYSYRHHH